MSDNDAREEARKRFEQYQIEQCGYIESELSRIGIGLPSEQYTDLDIEDDWRMWQSAESQRTQAPSEQSIRTALMTHWLSQIECNHYEKNDSAICACGWKSDRGFNVGKAVEFWINHVFEVAGTQAQAAQSDRCDMCNEPVTGSVHYELPGRTHRCCRCMERMKEPPVIEGPASSVAPVAALEGNK